MKEREKGEGQQLMFREPSQPVQALNGRALQGQSLQGRSNVRGAVEAESSEWSRILWTQGEGEISGRVSRLGAVGNQGGNGDDWGWSLKSGALVWTYLVSSVTQSCLTLCDPMNCSTPGLPVHHQLPESTQTHVH